MINVNSRNLSKFIRILASVMALVLLCAMPIGVFSALADEGDNAEPYVGVVFEEQPDDGQHQDEEQPGEQRDWEQLEEQQDEEQPEERQDKEQPETEAIELTGYFDQFVTSAVLIGTDGAELSGITDMKLTDSVTLRLTAELDTRVLSAIRESGDTRYTVRIPYGLTARNGTYEFKARGEILGSLQADGDEFYFTFNTGEDSLFGDDEPQSLKGLRLDIPCLLDASAIGENGEIVVDLSEYPQGTSYSIKCIRPGIGLFLLPVNPAKDFTQFVKSATLTADPKLNTPEISDPYLMRDDGSVYLRFEFEDLDASDLAAIVLAGESHQYPVTIPNMLIVAEGIPEVPLNVTVEAADGKDKTVALGTLHIASDGVTAYFTFNTTEELIFNNGIAELSELGLFVRCELDIPKLGDNDRTTEINMTPYDDDKTYNIVLSNRTPAEPEMFKSGKFNEETGLHDWTVTIMASASTDERDWFTDLVLTDVTGPNHTVWGDVKVEGTIPPEASTTIDYGPKPEAPPNAQGYVKTATGFSLELAGPYTGDITITYSTTLTKSALEAGGNLTLPNTATLGYKVDDVAKSLTKNCSLEKINASFLGKNGEFIDGEKAIKWTVVVDTLGQGFNKLIVHDKMGAPLKYKQDSVMVNGDEAADGLSFSTDGDEMTLVLIAEGGAKNYSGTVYTITYLTPVTGINYWNPDDTTTASNTARLEFDWLGGPGNGPGNGTVTPLIPPTIGKEGVAAKPTPVKKEFFSYDTKTKVITWKITVNSNNLAMERIKLTDTIPGTSDGHENPRYVPNSLTIGGVKMVDSLITDNNLGVFTIAGPIDKAATFLVETDVTDDDFLSSNGGKKNVGGQDVPYRFENDINMEAYTIGSEAQTPDLRGSDSDYVEPSNNILAKTQGMYDYENHVMPWTITVNADKITPFTGPDGGSVVVTDVIEAGQELAKADGAKASVITDVTVIGGGTVALTGTGFTVTFNDLDGQTATIKYYTRYTNTPNDVTEMSFKNTAALSSQYGSPSVDVTAPVPIDVMRKSQVSVEKPNQSTALVSYRVFINQSNIPINLTGNAPIKLVDTITKPTGGTISVDVDLTAVKLYQATINANGDFTIGNDITAASLKSKDFTNGDTITVEIASGLGACVLDYEVIVRDTSGAALSGNLDNAIIFDNFPVTGDYASRASQTTNLSSESGSGGKSGKYITVEIIKKDEKPGATAEPSPKPLPGVTFGLYMKKVGIPTASDLIAKGTTDRDGKLTFTLLIPSNATSAYYYIREEETYLTGYTGRTYADATPYEPGAFIPVKNIDDTLSTYTHTLTNERTAHPVTFYKVRKNYDGSYGLVVDGDVTFELTDMEDANFTETLTESDGIFTISDLKWGTYALTETARPDVYVTHTGTYTLTVNKDGTYSIAKTNNSGGTYPVGDAVISFTHNGATHPAIVNEKGSITITKRDSETGAIITNDGNADFVEAMFQLQVKSGDDFVDMPDVEFPTIGGVVTFHGLDLGKTYRAVETQAPTGYTLSTPPYVSNEFIIGGAAIHYAQDAPNARFNTYSFSFTKKTRDYNPTTGAALDTETPAPEGEAQFKLLRLDITTDSPTKGTFVDTGKTAGTLGTDGLVTFSGVSFGTYQVIEIKAPGGYALLDEPIEVVVSRSLGSGTAATVTINGSTSPYTSINEKGSYTITKKDNLYTSAPLVNLRSATFKVTKVGVDESAWSRTMTTNELGVARIDGLDIGTAENPITYTFAEISAPTGYTRNTATLTFTPSPTGKKGEGTVDGTAEFGNNRTTYGTFSFTKVGEDGSLLNDVSFTLRFVDPQPDGAQHSSLPSTWKSDATGLYQRESSAGDGAGAGTVTFRNLPYGSYIVTEDAAPAGYVKNTTPITFTIAPDGVVTSSNLTDNKFVNLLGKFTLIKRDGVTNTLMPGVVFRLYESADPGTQIGGDYTTGEFGDFTISNLKIGTSYTLEEQPPVGYAAPAGTELAKLTFTLTIANSNNPLVTEYTKTVELNNARNPIYSFGFKKQDKYSTAVLDGATFGLFYKNSSNALVPLTGFNAHGDPVTAATGQYTATSGEETNSGTPVGNGDVKFDSLPFGTYYAQELAPPPQGENTTYKKSDVVLEVAIDVDGKYTITYPSEDASDIGGTAATSIPSGTVSGLAVKNDLLGSITVTKQDRFGKKLQNANFTLRDTGNSIMKTDTTDTDGIIKFDDLPLGKTYTITEDSAPAGYELPNLNSTTVLLEYSTGRHAMLTVDNERIGQYSLDFLKRDPFGKPLENAEFGIMQVADNAAYSQGMTLTADDTSESDAVGKVEFDDLSFGRFFIWETTPPSGYEPSDTVLQADISFDGNSITLIRVSGADMAESGGKAVVINERGKHPFSFDKLAQNTGDGLAGAVFTITPTADSGGDTVTLPSGTTDTASSDAQGKVTFAGLPFGAYLVNEASAPRYYVKCEGSFKVEIDIDGNVTFSSNSGDPDIAIATDGSTVSVTNLYNAPPPSPGGSGGGGGGSGSGGGYRDPDNSVGTSSQSSAAPSSFSGNLPPIFPQGSTVTAPAIIQRTDDYTIATQTITTPKGESYDAVIITVTNPGGAIIGEIAPPPSKEGGEFAGWYMDPEMTIPYDPNAKIPQGGLRLYAKWYFGVSSLDNHNPDTGDNFARKPAAITAIIALIAASMALTPFKKRGETSVQ